MTNALSILVFALSILAPASLIADDRVMRASHPTAIVLFLCLLVTLPSFAQHIECQPCGHHFGEVQIGNSATATIQLDNTGRETLTIDSVSEQGPEFTVGNLQLPANVAPGGTLQLPVTFTPTAPGHVNGSLSVASNAPNSPLTLALGGNGQSSLRAQLSATPPTVNFGNVTVGNTASASVNLTASNGNVTISSDQTSNPQFVIAGLRPPVTIRSGESLEITIQFTPSQSGSEKAQADIASNADNSPLVEQVSGTGLAQQSHSVSLTWNPGEQDPAGYNIYRGSQHGGPYNKINGSLLSQADYTDYNIVAGDSYYYVSTEVNNEGQESGYSNEAEAKIPSD